MRARIKKLFNLMGLEITKYKARDEILEIFNLLANLKNNSSMTVGGLNNHFLDYCFLNCKVSRSQLFQDLFVQFLLKDKYKGYFVEFGATDGISLSNTYLLEKKYGWSGILAEPAKCWKKSLRENRDCNIDTRCVWRSSGDVLEFNETLEEELSTINNFSNQDLHSASRLKGTKYDVESISLNDLLLFHGAPRDIDYLSIDTEGSELTILTNFNFDIYNISIITVEHNFTNPIREEIHSLLTKKGYVRVMERFSQWDDWYVKKALLKNTYLY